MPFRFRIVFLPLLVIVILVKALRHALPFFQYSFIHVSVLKPPILMIASILILLILILALSTFRLAQKDGFILVIAASNFLLLV